MSCVRRGTLAAIITPTRNARERPRGWVEGGRQIAPIGSRGRVHARAPWPLCKHEREEERGRRGSEAR